MDKSTRTGTAKLGRPYKERPKADQITELPSERNTKFDHCQFPGFVSGVKQGTRGDLIFQITVPARWRHLADGLFDASLCPLSIDIQRWELADG